MQVWMQSKPNFTATTCKSRYWIVFYGTREHIIKLFNSSESLKETKTTSQQTLNKSSAVAEMDDRGHNRHGSKRRGAVRLSRSAGNPSNTMWPAPRSTIPYQVASSSIQPFGHNSVGCHSPRRNISTNYYFVVEMLTVTVRSDDARYLLKKFN